MIKNYKKRLEIASIELILSQLKYTLYPSGRATNDWLYCIALVLLVMY